MTIITKITYDNALKYLEQLKFSNRERISIIYGWIVMGYISEQTFAELLSYGWRLDVSG